MPITPCTIDYTDALATGRLLIMQYETSTGASFMTNIYGWTGGVQGSVAAGRTNDLIKIALNELALQPEGPQLICGDINGDTCNFACLHALLEDGGLLDLGASQQLTQKDLPDYTCQAKLGGRETRRDYIFTNPAGLDNIQRVEVHTIPGIPTHRAVDAISTFNYNGPETKSLQMPLHAATLFEEAVTAELKYITKITNSPSREDLTARTEELSIFAIQKKQSSLLPKWNVANSTRSSLRKNSTLQSPPPLTMVRWGT